MATDLPYAAEAEITLSPDELEVSTGPREPESLSYMCIGPETTILQGD